MDIMIASQAIVADRKVTASFFWPSRNNVTGLPSTKSPVIVAERTKNIKKVIGPQIFGLSPNKAPPLVRIVLAKAV